VSIDYDYICALQSKNTTDKYSCGMISDDTKYYTCDIGCNSYKSTTDFSTQKIEEINCNQGGGKLTFPKTETYTETITTKTGNNTKVDTKTDTKYINYHLTYENGIYTKPSCVDKDGNPMFQIK